jgi:hypothetical protein
VGQVIHKFWFFHHFFTLISLLLVELNARTKGIRCQKFWTAVNKAFGSEFEVLI